MDLNSLLLLGLLQSHSQHGYQLNEFIDRRLSSVTNLKKPTAYAILDRLEAKGLVESSEARQGKRPTRKVYGITEEGRRIWAQELEKWLCTGPQSQQFADLALLFAASIDGSHLEEIIGRRLETLEDQLESLEVVPKHRAMVGSSMTGIDWALDRQRALITADMEWFQKLLGSLKKGS